MPDKDLSREKAVPFLHFFHYSSVHLTSYAEEATTKQEALIAPESFSSSLFLAVEKFRPKESYLPPSSLPYFLPPPIPMRGEKHIKNVPHNFQVSLKGGKRENFN